MGMEINMPMFVEVPKNFPESFIHQINSVVQTNSKLQLIIVILSSQRDDYYNAIKRLCCAQVGIPSQVIKYTSIHITISSYYILFLDNNFKNIE